MFCLWFLSYLLSVLCPVSHEIKARPDIKTYLVGCFIPKLQNRRSWQNINMDLIITSACLPVPWNYGHIYYCSILYYKIWVCSGTHIYDHHKFLQEMYSYYKYDIFKIKQWHFRILSKMSGWVGFEGCIIQSSLKICFNNIKLDTRVI